MSAREPCYAVPSALPGWTSGGMVCKASLSSDVAAAPVDTRWRTRNLTLEKSRL